MTDLQLLLLTFAFLVPASLLSIEFALSVSIFEIVLGVVARNTFGMESFAFLRLVASFAGIVLTFLAGTEVDRGVLRSRFRESFVLGSVSFFAPFLIVLGYCYKGLGWTWEASQIGAIALSTTSLAVVYAVLVETGLTRHPLGKLAMASCFVTDFFVAAALSTLFVKPTWWTLVFAVASVMTVGMAPCTMRAVMRRYGERVIEVEIKVMFLVLLGLMVLGELGSSHAMLPAFILGLVLSEFFEKEHALQRRLRTVCFSFITPFFFFNSGLRVPLKVVLANLGSMLVFLGLKIGAKIGGVLPLASRWMNYEGAMYVTLLLSTGLTMGTLTSTYGLEKGIIDETQFSLLLATVIASAILPTLVAQRFFQPDDIEAHAVVHSTPPIGQDRPAVVKKAKAD